MVIAVGLIVGGVIKFEFFPHVEGETVAAKLTLPKGAPAEQTAAAVARIEAAARSLNETLRGTNGEPIIRHMLAHEGSQPFKVSFAPSTGGGLTENLGEVTLELLPAADRTISTETIVAEWRKRIGEIPGVEELSFIGNTSRTGNAFDLEFHSPDPKELRAAVDFFKEKLRSYASVADVSDNNRQGKRELLLGVTPQGETAQLTLGMISNQVRQAFYGEEVHRLQRGRDEVKVMLRYPREERLNLDNLERMQLRLPDGTEVPFHEAATAESARGPASIYRAEQQPAIRVTGDINKSVPGANANEVVKDLDEKIFPEMLQRFPSVSYAYQGEQKDQRQSMQELGFGFILALAGIFIILAIPLRSYVQPLIVMSVIPFGALGAVVGHVLFQVELSIMSMIGIVAVAGVVVNESLVLVEYVNRHRQKGLSVLPAAQEAACARFQAIMLTSVTSFIGILPLMLEKSLQAKFLIPCGISLAFGCLFNLVNTLVLVPNVYAILEDIKGMLFTPTKLAYMEEQEQQEAAERGVEWM
jgi:multidrug efflux pump subunit AcrB